jgi:predicted DNA-binding transcriptional regulator YafY
MSTRERESRPPSRSAAVATPARVRSRGPKRGRPPGKFTQNRRLERLREALEKNAAGLSIAEIAQLLHVTPRSVRRYLGYLRLATPIEALPAAPGRENVWRIKPSERARSVPLRRAPAYCLLAARAIFEPLKGSALFDALDLVYGQVLQVASRPAKGPMEGEIRGDARLDERFLCVSPPPAGYSSRAEEIDDLFRAVADLHVLRFRLREAAGRAERVIAHPYALYLRVGALHLVAFDVERAEVRVFPFERMADLELAADERFVVPSEFQASALVHGVFGVAPGPARIRLLVEFDARVADEIRARKLHPAQKIATAPDGRVRLSVQLPEALVAEARRWILGFADAARVIEPPELADDVARSLLAAAKRYG